MNLYIVHRLDPVQLARLEALGVALIAAIAATGSDPAAVDAADAKLAKTLKDSTDRLEVEMRKYSTPPEPTAL